MSAPTRVRRAAPQEGVGLRAVARLGLGIDPVPRVSFRTLRAGRGLLLRRGRTHECGEEPDDVQTPPDERPVPGAAYEVLDANGDAAASGTTGEAGDVRARVPAAGSYTVKLVGGTPPPAPVR